MHKHLMNLVSCLSDLPGIGPRSAMRIALSFLKQDKASILRLCKTMESFCEQMSFCTACGNLQMRDAKLCDICLDAHSSRDAATLCVVENVADLMAVENTKEYSGVYHVLGGVLSPLNGVGPEDLRISTLLLRMREKVAEDVNAPRIREVLLATNPTLEGDTTANYIYDLAKSQWETLDMEQARVTRIQHGLASGQSIEFADQNLLAHSIRERREIRL